jgi:hypothetical protein
MKLELLHGKINYVARLGRRKGVQPILVKFTSFLVTLEALKKADSQPPKQNF